MDEERERAEVSGEQPIADEPATDEPATDEPATDEPAAEGLEPAPGPPAEPGEAAAASSAHAPAAPELGPEQWYSPKYREEPAPRDVFPLGLGFGVPDDVPGWVTVTGLGAAIVSLLLPWVGSEGFLIGGPGSSPTSYFGSWGMGAPSNWLTGILLLVAVAFIVRTPRDPLRHGLVPLGVALFALGNVWPYVPYVGYGWVQPGVWLMVAGCVVTAAGAAMRLAPRLREAT